MYLLQMHTLTIGCEKRNIVVLRKKKYSGSSNGERCSTGFRALGFGRLAGFERGVVRCCNRQHEKEESSLVEAHVPDSLSHENAPWRQHSDRDQSFPEQRNSKQLIPSQ